MINSIVIRLQLWEQAINAWLSSPWTGIGWGELGYYMYLNKNSIGIDRNAHNVILHFLAETGIIGTICLALALYYSLSTTWHNKYIPFYAIIGIQIIHSMLEFPYAYMPWLIILGLSIGMINNAKR